MGRTIKMEIGMLVYVSLHSCDELCFIFQEEFQKAAKLESDRQSQLLN